MRQNLKNRRNPSHQISENFGKSRNFVIFWYFGFIKVYFVFWYFACISYFNFEIFKNPQPVSAYRARCIAGGRSTGRCSLLTCLRSLENFKIKIRNTSKISKYKIHFEKAKISKYPKISRFSENFQNLVRRISAIFEVLTHFPHSFLVDLEKSWKMPL